MKKNKVNSEHGEIKKIYRKAKPSDLVKWQEAIQIENDTMIRSRLISEQLNLDMKIGDVEYQGDRTKAIFYYIADDRVDFRKLIKLLADEFKVRIEMKQIGARQEAGRIGGIGSCGRELCCSTWITNFVSVTTNAARYQEVSLNPQKLAGQCSKLKCCLNYELECYLDALEGFPSKDVRLETKSGPAFFQKSDIYRQLMWYSFDPDKLENLTAVPVERVHEIIALNKKGIKVDSLIDTNELSLQKTPDYTNSVGEDSVTRFDKKKKNKKRTIKKKKSFSKRNKKK
jgi:cell fate regulator YaaT (PSP1 superfamily)